MKAAGENSVLSAPALREVGSTALAVYPEPRCPRYESLTAWRGIACLFVVIFHIVFAGYGLAFPEASRPLEVVLAILRRLWIGVPLFFVISGYCVTASADAIRRGSQGSRHFFWRRFRRIYPPYWAWFAIAAVTICIIETFYPFFFTRIWVSDPRTFDGWQGFGNLTLTETWRWQLTGGVENLMLWPAWTLCYEEQFYAVVGLALLVTRRFFFLALGIVTIVVLAGLFLFPALGIPTTGLFIDGKWLMFAAGVLVYYTRNYLPERAAIWASLPLAFGALCALASPEHLLKTSTNEPNQTYFAAFSFALLLLALHPQDNLLTRARIAKPLMFCGEMCFSLYLVHWPAVVVTTWVFNQFGFRNAWVILFGGVSWSLLFTLALARAFHVLVERRCLNTKKGT